MSRVPKFRILIVDDEKVQLEMLEGFLVKQGYEATAAEDGQKALEKFKTGTFDLVLTDFRMPGMDGIQLLREVRRLQPQALV